MNEITLGLLLAAGVIVAAIVGWLRWNRVRDAEAARAAAARSAAAAAARAEAARLATERANQAEAERQAAERAELARRQAEAERRAMAERIEAEQRAAAEAELAARTEQQRQAEARAEAERIVAAQREAAEREAVRQAKLAAQERAERERTERERAEAERLALLQAQRAEAERVETERRAAAAAQAEAAPTPIAPKAPQDALVLIVDDSKVVRVKTGRMLAQQGYRVAQAVDGADAAQQLQTALPDLVITDVEMPGLDGFELTRLIRSRPASAQLPVIMITGADDRHRAEAEAAGVSLLLGKPYDDGELLAQVRRLTRQEEAAPA